MGILDGDVAGVNQILGAKHKYPLELYKKGMDDHWRPQEISHTEDRQEWNNGTITDQEKLIIKRALGFFSAGESEVNNNIFLSEYRFIVDGACRQYLVRKAMEEAIHNETVGICCEVFSLNEQEVAEAYLSVPAVKKKSDFLLKNTSDILEDKEFDISTLENKRKFLKNIFVFYVICEGTFFWSSFVLLLSICQQGKLPGFKQQLKFTILDESKHINFGFWLIKQIKEDYPEIWSEEFQVELTDLMMQAVELEIEYAKDSIPEPMLGMNSDMFIEFMQFIGNIRLESVGLKSPYGAKRNPFPWVEGAMESKVLVAFFEQMNTDYRTASALVDDY